MASPPDRKYARTHVWALAGEGGDVRVGLTHHPGSYLGDAVYVELPPARTDIQSGEPVGLVESSSAVCEVVAPVSGIIVAINPLAEHSPEMVTAEPYGDGWLMLVRPSDPSEMEGLLSGPEYDRLIGEE